MKLIGGISLFFLSLSIFLSFLILTSVKFQLLNHDFWIKAFREGGVYEKIESPLKKAVEVELISKEGSTKRQAQSFSKGLTASFLQNLIEKNIQNIINFINFKEEKLLIFIPKEILPTEGRSFFRKEEFAIEDLMSIFSRGQKQQQTPNYLLFLNNLNRSANISWFVTLAILIGILVISYLSVAPGARLIFPGLLLIIVSAVIGIFVLLILGFIAGATKDLILPDKEPVQIILGTFAPPILNKIFRLWLMILVFCFGLGVVFLFLRKPQVARRA